MIENFGDKRNSNGLDKNKDNINKNGAPKGERLVTKLKKLLKSDAAKIDKALEGLSVDDALMLQLVKIGLSGDDNKEKLSAIKEILDRIEGKSTQFVETKDVSDAPKKIEFVKSNDKV